MLLINGSSESDAFDQNAESFTRINRTNRSNESFECSNVQMFKCTYGIPKGQLDLIVVVGWKGERGEEKASISNEPRKFSKRGQSTKANLKGAYLFAVHLDVGHIVLENGWYINFWKLIFTKHNQTTGFAAGAVAHDHQFLSNRGHSERVCTLSGQHTNYGYCCGGLPFGGERESGVGGLVSGGSRACGLWWADGNTTIGRTVRWPGGLRVISG